jgi:hypothetical protein
MAAAHLRHTVPGVPARDLIQVCEAIRALWQDEPDFFELVAAGLGDRGFPAAVGLLAEVLYIQGRATGSDPLTVLTQIQGSFTERASTE